MRFRDGFTTLSGRSSGQSQKPKLLRPGTGALAPGGHVRLIQSIGNDPGMDIVHSVWPEENLIRPPRRMLPDVLESEMKAERRNLRYFPYADSRSLFRYQVHTLASKISRNIGTSTLRAAWSAAVHVAQIEDAKLIKAQRKGGYLSRRRKKLQRAHDGL